MTNVIVQTEDFDVGRLQADLRAGNPKIGGLACFTGLVRDVNEGDSVSELVLEHYPGMTERAIDTIIATASERWDVIDAIVVHRVGALQPTDQIVFVAVASGHRGDAFAACEYIMDYLKTKAPFWKKEGTGAGNRWVAARDSDTAAAARWKND